MIDYQNSWRLTFFQLTDRLLVVQFVFAAVSNNRRWFCCSDDWEKNCDWFLFVRMNLKILKSILKVYISEEFEGWPPEFFLINMKVNNFVLVEMFWLLLNLAGEYLKSCGRFGLKFDRLLFCNVRATTSNRVELTELLFVCLFVCSFFCLHPGLKFNFAHCLHTVRKFTFSFFFFFFPSAHQKHHLRMYSSIQEIAS